MTQSGHWQAQVLCLACLVVPGAAMRRREFIYFIGSAAAAWPSAANAQQLALPKIGFLNNTSLDPSMDLLRAFHQGLKENGYVEGENVTIDYRWADNRLDQLPNLAADLVRRAVTVIVTTGGSTAALAAKAATATIPICFVVGEDPVRVGLVASLARPGGNLTGINFLVGELGAKRLDLLRELVPSASRVAVLVNPAGPNAEPTIRDVEAAGRAMGLQTQLVKASTSSEINAAFATFVRERPDALLVGADPFFTSRRAQLVQLAAHHSVIAIYSGRQFPEIGGLISYGASLTNAIRQIGLCAGRILKGAKPADLPVEQSTKFELVINAETARMLGLTVPAAFLARADDVID